jgi:alpha-N-acetylglucosamine transferase
MRVIETKQMNRQYVAVISTDDYVDGLLVMHRSLLATGTRYGLRVLVTPEVTAANVERCRAAGMTISVVEPIDSGLATVENDVAHWAKTYTKLNIFGITDLEKLVFLDADMVICSNIDELFDWPHMSAVNAGGELPQLAHWRELNSGLMVVEPRKEIFDDMRRKIGTFKLADHGDQTFLHAYYPDWPERPELHLPHTYNQMVDYIDEYHTHRGYQVVAPGDDVHALPEDRRIKVLHYIGTVKPWHRLDRIEWRIGDLRPSQPQRAKAYEVWLHYHRLLTQDRSAGR